LFVGEDAFLPEPASAEESVRARGEDRLTTGLPWLFLLLGLGLVLALATNERLLARLEVSR
jgi:hypothetical protein